MIIGGQLLDDRRSMRGEPAGKHASQSSRRATIDIDPTTIDRFPSRLTYLLDKRNPSKSASGSPPFNASNQKRRELTRVRHNSDNPNGKRPISGPPFPYVGMSSQCQSLVSNTPFFNKLPNHFLGMGLYFGGQAQIVKIGNLSTSSFLKKIGKNPCMAESPQVF